MLNFLIVHIKKVFICIYLRSRYTDCATLLVFRFPIFTNLPLNKEATFAILQELALSPQAWEIIKLSFRTRIKANEEGVIGFQFRILPENITPTQQESIPVVREEILQQIIEKYPTEKIDVIIQVTLCCMTQCFWCRSWLW